MHSVCLVFTCALTSMHECNVCTRVLTGVPEVNGVYIRTGEFKDHALFGQAKNKDKGLQVASCLPAAHTYTRTSMYVLVCTCT